MKAYLAYTLITLRLTLRDKAALFFNYIFPLLFFFIFAQSSRAEQGGVITQVVTMVLILAVLGNGLFGAGVRAVQDRELNILRRFKVTPISSAPILVASMITGWIVFLPAAFLVLALAHFLYGMPVPEHVFSLFWLISLGVVGFRAIGLIVASVVNSAQENTILIQILYLPMLFLSGAVFPITMLPEWAQVLVQLLPASYLSTGFQGILLRGETLGANWSAIVALLLTTALATFLSMKLFRWEKEEKLPASAKLWMLVVLLPFIALGSYQAYSRENVNKARLLYRDVRRSRSMLIRDARIFIGDGKVIESGGLLVRNGKIEEVYEGKSPSPKDLKADVIEASGKTLLPGLIDTSVHLEASGGVHDPPSEEPPRTAVMRALAAYLYSGVTSVKSAGDPIDLSLEARARIESGERLGAEVFLCGPVFVVDGERSAEFPIPLASLARAAHVGPVARLPRTPEEARRQTTGLKAVGLDAIQVLLAPDEEGERTRTQDLENLRALAEAAALRRLPVVVHTGDRRGVTDALAAGVSAIEQGSARDSLANSLFSGMAQRGAFYVPVLSVTDACSQALDGRVELLERSLILQVGPASLVTGTRKALESAGFAEFRQRLNTSPPSPAVANENLRRAHRVGVLLAAGSGSGSPLIFHGPAIHRELQLWVQAGIPPADALQAATYNAARLLGAGNRIGLIREGWQADLLLVDGNPLQDISATERISVVIFKGERVNRSGLFEED